MKRALALTRVLCLRGVRSDGGLPWVSIHRREGYVDLDTHGLPRPLSAPEARHLAALLSTHADALEPPNRADA